MKLSVRQLKNLVKEDYMKGMPEFVLRQAADNCVNDVKKHIVKGISMRAKNATEQREMIAAANVVLEELRAELYAKLEDKLFQFLQEI